ncbi:chromosome segregation SMC family protein [Treponema sp.]|uniref:chromosome segregation SMC family protein n=1 Tax=Treponema sp. TaxID=166 RepID=UPI00298EA5B5|nr:AAA family ATPase [Treponema sp.]MCQ2241873.1 AAA family ATPase [Treponema sp.]
MFLKSLEIFGFKSFADRTHINFADGITALLGPNGCGKSNVVDAIKWVLAENKSKNLRAENMADVIFNGTESRAALSMAEVTLTIANENGLLQMDETEIAIKRRIYRNGENEYFINGKQVTATKVRQLFMDTGVGKAAYSVMEQGKIDQILSSKPEDRRYLFEEAAGISRSKAEVQEAERELERTKANLAQIDIGLAETKRSYETLKAQSDKTAKYRKYNEDKFNYELDIQLLRLKNFTQDKTHHQQALEEADKKRLAAENEIEEIYNTLHENTDKIKSLQEQVNQKTTEAIKLQQEVVGKKALAQQFHVQQSQSREKIGQIENRIKNIEQRIDEYNEDIDSQNADLHDLNKKLTDINKNIEGFVANIQQSQGQIEENQKIIGTNGGKVLNLNSARGELQKKLAAITEDIVTELDAKLKDAGYSAAANKKAKEELNTQLEKIKIFANGRANIFKDFASLPSHPEKESAKMGTDAVNAFTDLAKMFDELTLCVESYTKTTPQFIDDFLSPEGIITQKRSIDKEIQDNLKLIDSIQAENEELAKKNVELGKRIDEYRKTLEDLRVNQAAMIQQIKNCEQQISQLKRALAQEEVSLKEQENELYEENKRRDEVEEQLSEIEEQIADIEKQGSKIMDEVDAIKKQIDDCNSKVSGKQNTLKKKQEERDKYQAQFEKLNVSLAQSDTEIQNVKQNFQDNYSRDLMEFEERMYKITTPVQVIREKLAETKQKIQELGQVNLMAVEQFAEEKERYERQQASYNDTKKTLENLVRVSEEIKTKSSEMFLDTYNKIRKNFHNMFRRLMNGGKAELKLVDPANVLTSGIDIYAQPPGKKLSHISLLSGGEKTMTAVALLFATYQVRPSPFCLLDEIDAALDDKNVSSFVSTLRAFGNISQYIVITHNRKTVMGASTMLGVTMEESGITKILQVRLDEDTLNGNITFDSQDDFVEEDVPPEEGIVIPPRPPRREHNPDGSLKIVEKPAEEKPKEVAASEDAPAAEKTSETESQGDNQ